jgi:signal transduction histidine kinase
MTEVAAWSCKNLIEAVEAAGVDPEVLVEGLSVSIDQIRQRLSRLPWEDYAVIVERTAEIIGGPDQLADACANFGREPPIGIFRMLAGTFVTSRQLYVLGAKWLGPSAYLHTRARIEELPDGRLQQTVEILPQFRECEMFFHGLRGVLRTSTRMLGQPDAHLEYAIEPRRAVYTIDPPKESAWAYFRRPRVRAEDVAEALRELGATQSELQDSLEEARRTGESLRAQTRRLEAEIEERKRTERELAHALRLEAVGRLAGGLAHDFNNVLTTISGYAELVSQQIAADAPAQSDLEEIHAVTQRATSLTSQVLAFSRREIMNPQDIELNALITEMEPMLRTLVGPQIDLVIRLGHLAGVSADPGRIEQVIVNLASNGRDAMADGGQLLIETDPIRIQPGARLEHPTVEPGEYVRLRVTDSGIGMDASTRERMYEPFFTTKPVGRGTGLGLSTVYGTVTHFGGALVVESEPGKGTAISIYLPRLDGQALPAAATEPEVDLAGHETVLLVEDDDAIRQIMERYLISMGYRVLTAAHGDEAIDRSQSFADEIDVLFTDIVMPGMDGRELADQICRLRPKLRSVVYTSGYVNTTTGLPERMPQEHRFLRKPYEPRDAALEIRSALDSLA